MKTAISTIAFLLLACAIIPACEENETVCSPSKQLYIERFRQGAFPTSSYAGVSDHYITSGSQANINWGNLDYFLVGHYDPAREHRGFLRFYIVGTIPSDAIVERSFITLANAGCTRVHTEIFEMTYSFYENYTTWNNCIDRYGEPAPGGSYDPTLVAEFPADSPSILDIELPTDLVQAWLASEGINSNYNYGLIFIPADDAPTSTYSCWCTKERSTVQNRPMLTIIYSLP